MTRRSARAAARPPGRPAPPAGVAGWPARLASGLVITLLCVTPLIVTTDTKESFRTVKALVAGWLALASLAACAWQARDVGPVSWRPLAATPAVRAVLPWLAVVLAGLWTTRHHAHFMDAAADVAIAVGCLIGWSMALSGPTLHRALAWSAATSLLVAVLTLDQAWGLTGVLDGLGVVAPTARLALTSTLGNPGDIGASLVLPLLLAAWSWPRTRGWWRIGISAALLLMTAALLVTTTLAALLAVSAGLIALVLVESGTRRRLLAAGALAGTVALVAMTVPAVRARVIALTPAVRAGDLNTVLTGRLDGWRVATALASEHPWTGVGQGGFVAEYAAMKLRLTDAGVPFYREQTQVMFDTPHNEYLSVAAEQGWPGVLTMAWGIVMLFAHAWRLSDAQRGMAIAGLVALAVLALAWFPLHVAAVAWPWVTFLAWTCRREDPA